MSEEQKTQNGTKLKTTVPRGQVFRASSPCPYCGGEITFTACAWEQRDDMTWAATAVDICCSNEPDIACDDWDEWSWAHGGDDYCQKWHDLHYALLGKLAGHVRFDLQPPTQPK